MSWGAHPTRLGQRFLCAGRTAPLLRERAQLPICTSVRDVHTRPSTSSRISPQNFSPFALYQRLVLLAARNEWAAALTLLGLAPDTEKRVHTVTATAIGTSETKTPHAETPTTTTTTTATSSSLASRLSTSACGDVECVVSLLLFYGHGHSAYAVWQAAERAVLRAANLRDPETTAAQVIRGAEAPHLVSSGAGTQGVTARPALQARAFVLQLAAYALLVEAAPARARDMLLLDDWITPLSVCTSSTEAAAPPCELLALLDAFLRTRLATVTVSAALPDGDLGWQVALTSAMGKRTDDTTYHAAVTHLASLHAQPEANGLAVYRGLVRHVLVPLHVVVPWYPFNERLSTLQHNAEDGADAEAQRRDARAQHQLQLHCAIDTGDWVEALSIVDRANIMRSQLHALRVCLAACEAAAPLGVAWRGALWAWERYAGCRESHHALTDPPSHSAPVPRKTAVRPLRAREATLSRKEAGRVLTLLAHGRRGQEAQHLFHLLPTALVDEYNVVQVAFAIAASSADAQNPSAPPRTHDTLLRLWAAWRSKVGDSVAPTTRLTTAFVHCGVRGSSEEARGVAALVTLAARQALAQRTPPSSQAPRSKDNDTADPPLAPGEVIPIDFAGNEGDLLSLLHDRWERSWQDALQVAIASGRPALYEGVAQHSPPHQVIYRAGMHAVRHDGVALSARQRVSFLPHLNAAGTVRAAAADAEKAPPGVSGACSPRRRDVAWAASLLDELLGEEEGKSSSPPSSHSRD